MTCEKPVIIDSLDDCCFTCYAEGRAPYNAPLAIVLHEYDGHIEELNNEMESCCNLPQKCHSSFHYGVGDGGQIYGWVDPSDTAWSFHPIRTDPNCGICDWGFGMSQGSQHPNLYTINIALATGTSSIKSGRRWPNNVFSTLQFDALVQLVGWLADTYGITVNQNMIWKHCDELADFPDLCGGCTFSDFLEAIQACIDAECVRPAFCQDICNCPVEDGAPAYVLGLDEECKNCGRYRFELCELIKSLQAGVFEQFLFIGVDDQGDCVAMEVDPSCNTTETVCSALGVNSNGVPGFFSIKEQLEDRTAGVTDSLVPATDRVVKLDAENDNVVFTLVPPGEDCCPKDYWLSRQDCNNENSVVIDGGGSTIAGVDQIALDTPAKWGNQGETIHLYYDAGEDNWIIL